MQHFSEEFSAEVVKQQYANCKDIRLKTIMESPVTHLHEFVKEVEPTQEEWMYMIEYLTKPGQKCDDKRQEFILLSDVLGISALVDTINNRKTLNATESTVLGPFHVKNAPIKETSVGCVSFVAVTTFARPCTGGNNQAREVQTDAG